MTAPQAVRRGRPRSDATMARDEHIHQLLTDRSRSRGELAAATGLRPGLVHLALRRLLAAGRVRQCASCGTIVWSVTDGTPCP